MDKENSKEPDENSIQVTDAAETEEKETEEKETEEEEETQQVSLACSPMVQNVSESEDVQTITDDS